MIKLENTEVMGWKAAIRGMRNPMNSWENCDSGSCSRRCAIGACPHIMNCEEPTDYCVGPNDQDLMKRLRNAGTDHRKFMRMITVYVDITAPLYWWKEFDTYKVGTVANSCSTMHKIADKEFTFDDFSHEHLNNVSMQSLESVIHCLNQYRDIYNNWDDVDDNSKNALRVYEKKDAWWQMIQLLPSSYNQRRTVMLNYEVLANMYRSRKNHKLDEWKDLCMWVRTFPYRQFITGEFDIPEEKK